MSFLHSEFDLSKTKVFLTHHLGEAEASEESLREHLRIKGKLPQVGESLWYLPKGVTNKMFAMPYGKVIRVETEPT